MKPDDAGWGEHGDLQCLDSWFGASLRLRPNTQISLDHAVVESLGHVVYFGAVSCMGATKQTH